MEGGLKPLPREEWISEMAPSTQQCEAPPGALEGHAGCQELCCRGAQGSKGRSSRASRTSKRRQAFVSA
eukprot:9485243-Alexandrium_andersonii.AAC.1